MITANFVRNSEYKIEHPEEFEGLPFDSAQGTQSCNLASLEQLWQRKVRTPANFASKIERPARAGNNEAVGNAHPPTQVGAG